MWAGQPRCGLTEVQGRLCGPGSHRRHEGSQVPRPAVRKLNSEPTPGSFGVVLLNPGTRLPSALVCSFPEKSSGARGRPTAAGSEEQDTGKRERKPQQAHACVSASLDPYRVCVLLKSNSGLHGDVKQTRRDCWGEGVIAGGKAAGRVRGRDGGRKPPRHLPGATRCTRKSCCHPHVQTARSTPSDSGYRQGPGWGWGVPQSREGAETDGIRICLGAPTTRPGTPAVSHTAAHHRLRLSL